MPDLDLALSLFRSGCNCAQSVLAAFEKDLGLDRGLVLRIACPFGAGMGRRGEVCGAVVGGLMALGLRHGMAGPEDKEGKERTYAVTREFLDGFEGRHGSLSCRVLTGCDLTTEEGMRRMKELDLHQTLCQTLVKDAVELAAKL